MSNKNNVYIPREYLIDLRVKQAVIEERDRCLRISNSVRDELLDFIDKLHSLSNSLQKVFYAALWARGEQLTDALSTPFNMASVLAAKLTDLQIAADRFSIDLSSANADMRSCVNNAMIGIVKVINDGENGEYLREIGKTYLTGGYEEHLTTLAKMNRGGRPNLGYRMLLAEYVTAAQRENPELTRKAILRSLQERLQSTPDLSDDWRHVLAEIQERSGRKRENWIAKIMSDFRDINRHYLK